MFKVSVKYKLFMNMYPIGNGLDSLDGILFEIDSIYNTVIVVCGSANLDNVLEVLLKVKGDIKKLNITKI